MQGGANYDVDSESGTGSFGPSIDSSSCDQPIDPQPEPSWPQTFAPSMHHYACSVSPSPSNPSFLRRGSSHVLPVDRNSVLSTEEPSLAEPLLDTAIISSCNEILPTSSGSAVTISGLSTTQKCTYSQSLFNAINALCGIGILSTPYAIKEGGWLSIVLLFFFGMITCYTGILLRKCLDSSSSIHTYPDIGKATYGIIGRIFTSIILYMELYFSCVALVIMMSDNSSSFFPNAELDIIGFHLNSYQICAIVSALAILPTVLLPNLRWLSYISVGGVISLVLVVLCLLWVWVAGEVGFHPTGKALNLPSLPITVGIYSYCYGSHSVFPNIYTSMEDPSRFPSVLAISFTVAALVYSGIGACGFLIFGEAIKPQFTLNMPKESFASHIAGWTAVATPLTKFALSITPVALAIEELLPSSYRSRKMSILIRVALLFSTLVLALTVPNFGSVTAFIGSFLVMLVSVILPCVCYMKLRGQNLRKRENVTCTFIIIFGVISAIVGTYSSLSSTAG